jgi:hypothetical protein
MRAGLGTGRRVIMTRHEKALSGLLSEGERIRIADVTVAIPPEIIPRSASSELAAAETTSPVDLDLRERVLAQSDILQSIALQFHVRFPRLVPEDGEKAREFWEVFNADRVLSSRNAFDLCSRRLRVGN